MGSTFVCEIIVVAGTDGVEAAAILPLGEHIPHLIEDRRKSETV